MPCRCRKVSLGIRQEAEGKCGEVFQNLYRGRSPDGLSGRFGDNHALALIKGAKAEGHCRATKLKRNEKIRRRLHIR